MKVTPVSKAFGKYQVGQVFEFPSNAAKVYIKLGKLAEVKTHEFKNPNTASEPDPVITNVNVNSVQVESEVEISPRTGLPKRVYRRRDMESE